MDFTRLLRVYCKGNRKSNSVNSYLILSLVNFLFPVLISRFLIAFHLFGFVKTNLLMLIGVLTILEATLTLPGIAGIILTVGMAVDANVLIFERIREELKTEKSAIHAFDSGYSRAKITVLDANITTLIAAVILFAFPVSI